VKTLSKIIKLLITGAFLVPLCAFALVERDYQRAFAAMLSVAQTEVVAVDGSRCDILTPEYAIEVDYANKWAESIGQALHYALMFNRRGGIVLILRKPEDSHHVERVKNIISQYNLPLILWTMDATKTPPAN